MMKTDLVLVGDAGGTNTTLAVLRYRRHAFEVLYLRQVPSRTITNFPIVVQQFLNDCRRDKNIMPLRAGFGAAGPVSGKRDFCKITHLPWSVDAAAIKKKTGLKSVLILNDFEAIAYGIEVRDHHSFLSIKQGSSQPRQTKIILGAGTDLGKSILVWDNSVRHYKPLPSEGGHGDISIQYPEEYRLLQFIQSKTKSSVAWGDILSGRGISTIYRFLGKEKVYMRNSYAQKIQQSGYQPSVIAAYKKNDPRSRDAFALFLRFYARCARNLALDVMALGGVYIAGGIAAKNPEIFQWPEFNAEFLASSRQQNLLLKIPIFLINDYLISLYGAAQAVLLQEEKVFSPLYRKALWIVQKRIELV